MPDFVHLHVHSEYSLLDGAARIHDIVARTVENGQKAVALTDHGCMYGVIAFYQACKDAGIKPIIGFEAYVAPRNMEDKEGKMDKEYAHLILLAKNQTGYQNLMKLSSMAYIKGYYYRPRIDYPTLETYSEGIIATSACLAGDLPRLLLDGRYEDAITYVENMKRIFGDDFYIELQDHGIPEEREVLPLLKKICQQTHTKPIAANDTHYVRQEDAEAQDALMCIQMGRYVDEENRMKMFGSSFYLKSTEEMMELFSDCPEAIENTNEIAAKCHVDFEFGKIHLPNYEVPAGYTHEAYLRTLCKAGLQRKCKGKGEEYEKRLDYELRVIEAMGYVDYFLIVWDFIDYAKRRHIMVGPGRGSAAGSLAAYCLDITDVDPIPYGLIFERFLNPERISMPDIDIDFCYERRQEVIDYVQQKYGADHVAQIITFGTMGAKQAIRDIGRVLRIPYGEVDKLSKMIPNELNMTLDKALEKSRELRETYEAGGDSARIIRLAKKIEGMPRHASTHAAGVVISAKPITEYVPLQKNDEAVTTQFPMGTIEELGLLKMDFLGLRTLTVIRDTLDEIERLGGDVPDMQQIPNDDAAVYKMISNGDTDGVFQLESNGMRAFLQQFRPDCFEDVIAGISLYRPGPMDQIPMYVERKYHPDKVKYDHPMLEPILSMTYGCMVYQEQVMQIVRDLAGYSWGHSDLVRRAMSKKKKDVMEKEESAFIAGCKANGIDESISRKIFASMLDFAQYAFNKSHAAAYAVVAYQTAWLKTHYEAEFLASLMNSFLNNTDKISEYIQTCRRAGIALLPPDINESSAKFAVSLQKGEKAIRFGLAAVKNVGFAACEALSYEREKNGAFFDFYEFVSRCHSFLNKRMLEYLIKAGALDCFGMKRAVLIDAHEKIMDAIAEEQRRNIAGQVSLFDLADVPETPKFEYPDLEEYSMQQCYAFEKEATSLYITGHPLHEFADDLQGLCSSRELLEAEKEGMRRDNEIVSMGGLIAKIRRKLTRNQEPMAYVEIEDMNGAYEGVVFPRVLESNAALWVEDRAVKVTGRINVRDDHNVLLIQSIEELAGQGSKEKKIQPGLYLRCTQMQMDALMEVARQSPGDTRTVFVCDGKALIPNGISGCLVDEFLIAQMGNVIGKENIKYIP